MMKFLHVNRAATLGGRTWRTLLAGGLAAVLAACGGGDGSEAPKTASSTGTAQVREVPMLVGAAGLDTRQVQIKTLALAATDRVAPRLIDLGPLPVAKAAPVGAPLPGQPLQIGVARNVPQAADVDTTALLLSWTTGADGRRRAAVTVQSPDASGLRLGLRVAQLPPGTQLRVYAPGSAEIVEVAGTEVLRTIQRNLNAGATGAEAYTYWLPTVEGPQTTLEIELAPGTDPALLKVSLPQVSHLQVLPTDTEALAKAASACTVDVMCTSGNDAYMRSVARMIFVQGGYGYYCTGTLLNNARQDRTPYFLTANHCISSQAVASSLETYWNYRSTSCNSGVPASNAQVVRGGATLRYASARTDTSFLQLMGAPPSNATYAAWNANAPTGPGTSVFSIHHPRGDLQKFSAGSVSGFAACDTANSLCSYSAAPASTFHAVTWSRGVTEPGSSGGALLNSAGQVIGQLYGGRSSCDAPSQPDFYGRFDLAYDAGLSVWLNPTDTPPPDSLAPVYRFYNTVTHAHFYTDNLLEREFVITNYPVFTYEGAVYQAYNGPVPTTSTVYRFYNTQTGVHFYTISAAERDYVIATYHDYDYEGPAWYARTTAGDGTLPVYRFYSAVRRAHFYTISAAERDSVLANDKDFNFEGVAYYAWPIQ